MSLKQINNDGLKEYVKMKIHELMFKAGKMNYIFQPSSDLHETDTMYTTLYYNPSQKLMAKRQNLRESSIS